MGRRRKKRFFKIKLAPKSTRSVAALLCLLLSFLTFFSYLGQAAFTTSAQVFLNRLFGTGAIFVPFLLLLAGLSLTQLRWQIAQPRVFFGSLLFTVSVLGLLHLFVNKEVAEFVAQQGKSGGLIGHFLAKTTTLAFSAFGAFLILTTAFIISLLIIFNTSLDELFFWLTGAAKSFATFVRAHLLSRTINFWETRMKKKQEKPEARAEEEAAPEIEIKEKEPEIEIIKEKKQAVAAPEEIPAKTKELEPYQYPSLSLLSEPEQVAADRGDIKERARIIEKTLESFGIVARVAEVNLGPAVTQYALELAEGTKIAQVTALQNDLAMALATPTGTVRIEAPIPGRSLVGVEVPNYSPSLVTLKSALTSEAMRVAKSKLTVCLGHNVAGETVVADIGLWPHVLICGATGAGKSVMLHSFISTLLFRTTPFEIKFILVDPKRVELPPYNGIPHLLTPVIVNMEKVIPALKWCMAEMEKRYDLLQKVRARNIADYNKISGTESLPYILIIVDELADIMAFAPGEVEGLICRIAQMSRATGIHLILSTQRPSVDVITGLIKANIPARIAFNVSSSVDSRVIIDMTGAEKLLGRGDMLYLPPDAAKPVRIQGVYVSDEERKKLIGFLRKKEALPEFGEEIVEGVPEKKEEVQEVPTDELFDDTVQVILTHDRASASLLQRRLSIGYARAARLLDELEKRKVVSPKNGSKPRKVFASIAREYLAKVGKEP